MDLGSNTFRLLIASPNRNGRGLDYRHSRLEVTRLAGRLEEDGLLDEGAVLRSRRVLASFIEDIRRFGADRVSAVGTGAVRSARDGREFADGLLRDLGLALNIVDQRTEALLNLQGVRSILGGENDLAVIDIGGRSSEVTVQLPGEEPEDFGLQLGAVSLYEAHIRQEPPAPADQASLEDFIGESLRRSSLPDRFPPGVVLVGTGGTFTTLAAVDQDLEEYDRNLVNGFRLNLETIQGIYREMVSLDVEGRAALTGLEMGRADIIMTGTALAVGFLGHLGRSEVTVSDASILEGALLAAARGQHGLEVTPAAMLKPLI
jgi:exopolyphosphatase/guanosine-5'-triphosphate,3'-diphosphate pyrophosphatase